MCLLRDADLQREMIPAVGSPSNWPHLLNIVNFTVIVVVVMVNRRVPTATFNYSEKQCLLLRTVIYKMIYKLKMAVILE